MQPEGTMHAVTNQTATPRSRVARVAGDDRHPGLA